MPVTPEQLAKMFAKAKDMVGLPDNSDKFLADMVRAGQIMYSDFNHVKYDFWRGAVFSYISKATIVKPSKTKMVCNRAVAEVVLAGLPDAMHTKHWLARNLHNEVNPANLTPSGFDGLMRNFSRMLLERIEG
ncbi:hypothetical protein KAR91_57455 [Candidatus Pacearchaeota archaeon]|nr:hypothetical protein [Candidatus Pacearchaeota archaeon]